MAYRDSNQNFVTNISERNLSLITICLNDKPSMPSQVIPGGETSPSTTFALYAKGAQLPNCSRIGYIDELPLDDSCAMPTTNSEAYLRAREFERKLALQSEAKAKAEAAEAAAKQAEIDAKIAFADAHMHDFDKAASAAT